MALYVVRRNRKFLQEVDTADKEAAINTVIENYFCEHYGECGPLTEREVSEAEEFESGKFTVTKDRGNVPK